MDVIHHDTFNDNALDTDRWTTDSSFSSEINTAIPVAEVGRRLEIGPLLDAPDTEYNAITTAQDTNFNGAAASVQLVKPAAGATAFSFMTVGPDSSNYYRIYVSDGSIVPLRRINSGAKEILTTIGYSANSHRYLRIQHDAGRNYVVFQASPTGIAGSWILLWEEPWNAAITRTAVQVELKAGTTGNSPSRDVAIFDNFTIGIVNSAQPSCTFAINRSSFNLPAASTSQVVAVTSGNGCTWTGASNASWLRIAAPGAGISSDTIGFTIDANTGGGSRTGTLTIAGRTVTITQSGVAASCSYGVTPTSLNVGAGNQSGTITVSAGAGCAWNASGSGFVRVTNGPTGSGSGSVTYVIENNTSTNPRSATLVVAGQSITVSQAGATGSGSGCVYEVSPTSISAGSGNTTGTLTVSTDAGCSWAASGGGFVQVTGGASGSGPGTVSYLVENNTSSDPRQANINVAGRTISVSQTGLDGGGGGDPQLTPDQIVRLAGAAEQIAALDPNDPASAVRMLEIVQDYGLVSDGLVEYFSPSLVDELRQELEPAIQGGDPTKQCQDLLRAEGRWRSAGLVLSALSGAFGLYARFAIVTPQVSFLLVAAQASFFATALTSNLIANSIHSRALSECQ